jgi:hypothetical protein
MLREPEPSAGALREQNLHKICKNTKVFQIVTFQTVLREPELLEPEFCHEQSFAQKCTNLAPVLRERSRRSRSFFVNRVGTDMYEYKGF